MLPVVVNILLIVIGFGLLIFVHELGHFLAAKWAGIRTEAFAIGMGPVIVSWRKGVGFSAGSTHRRVVAKTGKAPADLSDTELIRHGVGETEYSLRWLPIGGFVKMLGQEDANPNYVSDDPRSYNRCSIGKRMVVVSAGVIMNLILAAVLFIVAFMIGVRFEAPVIGEVSSAFAAGTTSPDNADAVGVRAVGLQPGDQVIEINGSPAQTFADLQIAAAMSKPGEPVRLVVRREGVDEPLRFSLMPRRDPTLGLLTIGIAPGSSTQIRDVDRQGVIRRELERTGLAKQGVEPGMRLISANGVRVSTFEQIEVLIDRSGGQPLRTVWRQIDRNGEPTGAAVEAELPVEPSYQVLRYAGAETEAPVNYELGLLGLTPLARVIAVPKDSPNDGILQPGDAVLRVGDRHGLRLRDMLSAVRDHAGQMMPVTVIRNGEIIELQARVTRRGFFDDTGMLMVNVGYAWDVPVTAEPIERVRSSGGNGSDQLDPVPTPVAPLALLPGTRVLAVGGEPVANWRDLRQTLRHVTREPHESESSAEIEFAIQHPTPGGEREIVSLTLRADEVRQLHALGWECDLPSVVFEPVYTLRSADGNPLRAVAMGIEETHKFLVLTYLTIDRLFRRTVGVDQLRGPVGIIHIGATIVDRGILYLVFLLAMISVNLAVINFLPLPIVDGGLFLFLVYEKFKGRPPSLAFQNAVTVLGLFIIGTLFIVVTYHDIMRLVG